MSSLMKLFSIHVNLQTGCVSGSQNPHVGMEFASTSPEMKAFVLLEKKTSPFFLFLQKVPSPKLIPHAIIEVSVAMLWHTLNKFYYYLHICHVSKGACTEHL
jgi:hypothetical protein